jgi:hypothetical protein
LEVTTVTVLPATEDLATGHVHAAGQADAEAEMTGDAGTASDVFPGIRDSHEGDDEGWMARWLDRPTWDRRVTPNVIKRTGTRPRRRR